jgi:uncharacterized membrane protein
MVTPAFINIVSNARPSLALHIFRTILLCLIAAWFIACGIKDKGFRYRGGRPMPAWLGRTVLIGFGLFFLASTFFLWNK